MPDGYGSTEPSTPSGSTAESVDHVKRINRVAFIDSGTCIAYTVRP